MWREIHGRALNGSEVVHWDREDIVDFKGGCRGYGWVVLGLVNGSESRWENSAFLQFPPSDPVEPFASAYVQPAGFLRQVE